jgi:cellulose biosynthesis protein BcsQ
MNNFNEQHHINPFDANYRVWKRSRRMIEKDNLIGFRRIGNQSKRRYEPYWNLNINNEMICESLNEYNGKIYKRWMLHYSLQRKIISKLRVKKPKIISMFTHKGGVGKSTMTVNIIDFLISNLDFCKLEKVSRILVIDSDPQMNLTQYLMDSDEFEDHLSRQIESPTENTWSYSLKESIENFNLNYKVESINRHREDLGIHTVHAILGSLVSLQLMSAFSQELQAYRNGMIRLFNKFRDDYDLILIDMSPSLDAINQSIINYSDHVISVHNIDIFAKYHWRIMLNNLGVMDLENKFIGYIINRFKPADGFLSQNDRILMKDIINGYGKQPIGYLEDAHTGYKIDDSILKWALKHDCVIPGNEDESRSVMIKLELSMIISELFRRLNE